MQKPSSRGFWGRFCRSALTAPDELLATLFSHWSGSPAVSWIITFDGILKVVRLSFLGIFFFNLEREKRHFHLFAAVFNGTWIFFSSL